MARKKGGPSRMDLRREAEAAEARGKDEDEREDEEEAGGEEAEAEEGDEEESPKKKAPPKKKPAAPKKPAAKRVRAQKEVRKRAIWVVFDNASKRVETFPFNQKDEAEALLARKQEEKKGTFYLNLVKEDIE